MFLEDIEKILWKFIMTEPFAFISAGNNNFKCLICSSELQKKEKV